MLAARRLRSRREWKADVFGARQSARSPCHEAAFLKRRSYSVLTTA